MRRKRLITTSCLLLISMIISMIPYEVVHADDIHIKHEHDYDSICVVVINEREESVIYDSADLYLIASVVYSEANTESERGKRLVIDSILNRIDSNKFPDSLEGVITQDSQFTRISDIKSKDKEIVENILALIVEELGYRTDKNVLFFRRDSYHENTKPILREGDHYFSGFN